MTTLPLQLNESYILQQGIQRTEVEWFQGEIKLNNNMVKHLNGSIRGFESNQNADSIAAYRSTPAGRIKYEL